MDHLIPTKENIRSLLLERMQTDHQETPQLDVVASTDDTHLDDLVVTWQDDKQTLDNNMQGRGLTRRQLFGPLLGTTSVDEQFQTVYTGHRKRKYTFIGGLAAVGLSIGALSFLHDQQENMTVANITTPTITHVYDFIDSTGPTLEPTVSQSDIVLGTVASSTTKPEITTQTTELPAITMAPTTAPSTETVPASPPSEIVDIIAPYIPEETIVLPAASVYDNVDCSSDTTVLVRGMTFSELADLCNITMENIQLYNSNLDLYTDFMTGTVVRLKPLPGSNTSQSQTSRRTTECIALGGSLETTTQGDSVAQYLGRIGTPVNIIYNLVPLVQSDYRLDPLIAGNKQCYPGLDDLQLRYPYLFN